MHHRQSHLRRIARPLAVTAALCGLTACDFNFAPELAGDAGGSTARVSVALGSANEAALADEIDGVDVEVVDVLVHSLDDDMWYLLNERSVELSLPNTNRNIVFKDAPVPAGEYDRVMVVLESAEVAADGGWRTVELVRDVLEIDSPMLLDRDGTLDLRFDLDGSIEGTFDTGFTMNPSVLVTPPQ